MKKAVRALALMVVMLIATAPSPPLVSVTGTVYNDNGLPAPGTRITFSSLSTQVVGGVEVPPSSFAATADATGTISVNLPRSLRVNVVIGKGAPMAVTLPNQTSIDLSALLAAVQVPPPASLVSSLSVASGGDYALSVSNPVGQGAATLSPGNVTRLNGNPVAALVPNPGQLLLEDAAGVAWEPFSLSGDATASAITPGQLTVNHFTLGSNASAGGFKLQNLAAGAATGEALAFGLNHLNDLAAATGNYAMASHRLTGLAAGAASGDSFALGLNSINQTAAPSADFAMNSHKLTGLAANTVTGDALSQGQSHLNDLAAATGNYAMGSNRLTGLAAPAATDDALSEGAPIGSITPAAGSFTSLTGSGTNGPALSNFNLNGAFNVKAYGAIGDATNDDAASIQAAINAACAVTTNLASGSTVYFPTGTYRHSKPLQLPCSNLTLAGAGWNSSTLYPAFGFGPAIMIVGSGYTGLETGTSLTTGAGSAMLFDGLRYWLNLRDSATLDLNGLSAFTVEAFVKPTATTDGQIIASSGRFLASSPVTQAFSLQMVSAQLEGRLNLGGTTYIVDSGSGHTLSSNTVYHVAMSWDGSTIRIFINGTQVASRSAGGTIQQAITEDVTVGPSIYDWPDGTMLGNAIHGYVDSIRLSKTARYTATFTAPTAKLTLDSNTLGLLNFDQVQGPMVGMYTGNGLAWIPVRRTNEPNGTSEISNSAAVLNNLVLRDFGINAPYGQSGIFATVTLNSVFDRLWISGTRNGLYLWNNCYQNSSHNLAINTSGTSTLGRIGLANVGQSGVNQFHHLRVNGGPYPLVDYEGSMLLDMLDVAQQSNTVYGAFFKAAGDSTITLNSPIIDVEAGGTTWLGALVFSGVGSAVANGGEIDSTNSAPAVVVDGGGGLSLFGNRMSLNGSPPAAIHVVNPPSQKIAVVEPVTIGLGSAPLSDLSSASVTLNKDKLNNVSVNGVLNVMSYGATASTTTATINSISGAVLTLAAAADFANGQNVQIPHAGATPAIGTPTGLTVVAHSTDNTVYDVSGCNVVGSITCTTSWTYRIVGVEGLNGVGTGGMSAPTSAVTITNGPSTRTVYDYNQLTWNVTNANTIAWKIYSCSGASCSPVLHAVIPLIYTGQGGGLPATQTWNDMGFDFGTDSDLGTSLPAGATRRDLYTTILSGGGTTSVTLAASPSVSSGVLKHDDSVPFQAAITAACVSSTAGVQNGTEVFIPSGVYPIAQTLSLYQCGGVKIKGAGANAPLAATLLRWTGAVGGTVLNVNQYANDTIEGVELTQTNGNTPGIALALDQYDTGGGLWGIGSTNFVFAQSGINEAGVGVMLSNQSASNVSESDFNDINIGYSGGWAGYYSNSSNVLNTHLNGGSIVARNYGYYNAYGAFTSIGTDFDCPNGIDVNVYYSLAPITIIDAYDENAARFLVDSRGYVNAPGGPISIIGSTLWPVSSYSPPDGIYLVWKYQGVVNLIGNMFGGNYSSTWRALLDASSYVDSVNSVGNIFPNKTPFASAQHGAVISQHSDVYDDVSGNKIPFPDRVLGPAPAVSTCGTGSPGVAANSTNYQGSIAIGSGTVTACTLTFNTNLPFINTPFCTLTDTSTLQALRISSASATAITFNAATNMAGDVVNYSCPAN